MLVEIEITRDDGARMKYTRDVDRKGDWFQQSRPAGHKRGWMVPSAYHLSDAVVMGAIAKFMAGETPD